MKSILLDTNIVLDIMQRRDGWSSSSEVVFNRSNLPYTCFITANAATDIHYLCMRFFHNEKKTREKLKQLFKIVSVLDIEGSICVNALDSPIKDYEDAVAILAAVDNGIDYIITRNLKDFSKSPILTFSPEQFLNLPEFRQSKVS